MRLPVHPPLLVWGARTLVAHEPDGPRARTNIASCFLGTPHIAPPYLAVRFYRIVQPLRRHGASDAAAV